MVMPITAPADRSNKTPPAPEPLGCATLRAKLRIAEERIAALTKDAWAAAQERDRAAEHIQRLQAENAVLRGEGQSHD